MGNGKRSTVGTLLLLLAISVGLFAAAKILHNFFPWFSSAVGGVRE